jgi:hypothetical protein
VTSLAGGRPFQEGGAASDTERRASLFIFDTFQYELCSFIDEDALFNEECHAFFDKRCSFLNEDALFTEECGTFCDERASLIVEGITFTAGRARFTAESGPFSPEHALDGHGIDIFIPYRSSFIKKSI